MTLALRSPVSRTLACAMVAALALCCAFSFAPRAHAAALTDAQVGSIDKVLVAFETDSATIAAANQVMQGGEGTVLGTTTSRAKLSLSVAKDSPEYIVAAGEQTVVLGTYDVHAAGDSFLLSNLGLKLTQGAPGDLQMVYVYAGSTLVGTAVFTGGNTTATTTFVAPLTVPQDGDVELTVRGDVAPVGLAQTGTAGDLIQVDPQNYTAVGVTSGANVSGKGTGHVKGVRVYRSFPTVAMQQGPICISNTCNGARQTVGRFSISANQAGPVGIDTLSVAVSAAEASVSNVRLYAFADPAYSQLVGQSQVGATCAKVKNVCVFNASPAIEIPAGVTYYFSVAADVAPSQTGNVWSVQATLIGDKQYEPLSTPSDTRRFEWSPNDLATAGAQTADWTNGYRIPGLVAPAELKEPALSLKADPKRVAYSGTSTLTWSAKNVDTCTLTGGGVSSTVGMSGSQSVGPLSTTTTYIFSCASGTTIAQQSVNIMVAPQKLIPPVAQPQPNQPVPASNQQSAADAFDPAGLMAAVIMAPFTLAIDSLTDIFVAFGVGQ